MLSHLMTQLVNSIEGMGYLGILLLMAMESSILPVPSELVMAPAGFLAAQGRMNAGVALLCGVVRWPQFNAPVSVGSRLGMAGPEAEMTLAPTALAVALLARAVALTLAPGVVPALETDALDGPPNTPVETPRAKPPASA